MESKILSAHETYMVHIEKISIISNHITGVNWDSNKFVRFYSYRFMDGVYNFQNFITSNYLTYLMQCWSGFHYYHYLYVSFNLNKIQSKCRRLLYKNVHKYANLNCIKSHSGWCGVCFCYNKVNDKYLSNIWIAEKNSKKENKQFH